MIFSGRKTCAAVLFFILTLPAFTLDILHVQAHLFPPTGISVLRIAYPDIFFKAVYDGARRDWRIELIRSGKMAGTDAVTLYWAEGKLLPEEELDNKEKYWPVLYRYTKKIPDPDGFTEEDIERIKEFTSKETRRNGAISPLFFFNAVYDSTSRGSVETHIVRVSFLGKKVSVHERIVEPLNRVEARIRRAAADSKDVQQFIDSLSRLDGYYWREIRDRYTRSFHSLGIAVDILPRGWQQKTLYWAWQKDKDPDGWMMTPLADRWIPPLAVIRAFEEEGFIWGGKWTVWDNMHFEYHPELILYHGKN